MLTTEQKGPHIWRPAFLAALSETGNVSAAARAAEVERATVYKNRQDDKDFAEAWDAALEVATDTLEAEARRRAVEGVDEPVFYKGVRCGVVRRYSDTLLIFLLKGNRPEKFKDRQELTGKDGQPLHIALKGVSLDDLGPPNL